jgi:Ca-activated chloride channel family protein
MKNRHRLVVVAVLGVLAASAHGQQQPPARPKPAAQDDAFRFKSGIELINVTASVSDASGHFISGLQKEDFLVYEDDQPVEVTQFSADRVPVSLGIALDTSGSMAGEKIQEAQKALDRFLYDLLDKDDEIFLYRFSNYPVLLQGWTTDREAVARALGRITPSGGTAMYDTIAEAIPLAAKGQHRKKAILLISDGNDTTSLMSVDRLKGIIRESEILVYAIGIDGEGQLLYRPAPSQPPRTPFPFPFPPRPGGRPRFPQFTAAQDGTRGSMRSIDHVNVTALRNLTDDSGGRTEIVRDPRDLNPSTANIADELSKQYYLGYPSSGKKDGRWHAIRVETQRGTYRVRARRGYMAN